ncbi:hypothetical protein A3L01_00435 [Thermococcus barossii]|uniref:Uncharacterized protein n=2 Tax=Thermococcus barossii TaxID=54077 RepID=A0A2Z2MEF9_9EURY|nr:hypothetical protein A3L01_00435 [Thermococcus barossii]
MRKAGLTLVLVFVLLFSVVASGCLGGGGGEKSSPSETYSETHSEGGGETQQSSSPGGGEESGVSTWMTPWDAYNPVQVGGQSYYITYIKYTFTVKSSEGERSYEVIKQRGYVKAHIYSDDNGKKDLGEYTLFAYYGKITPLNDPDMSGPLEYLILIKERTRDSDTYFLTPFPDFGAMMSGTTAVIEASYGGNYFYWSNPAAVGEYSELPYTEGDFGTVMGGISGATIQGWMAMVSSAVWTGLEDHDLSKPDEYSFSFMGMGYSYKVEPDGTVTFDGKSFKVSDVEWSWAFGNVRGQGKAKIAPALPIPVETEGTFSQMGGESYYSKLKIKDLRLSREFEGIDVEIESPTSPGETGTSTETQTETSTEAPGEGSDNWKLAWDASEPITINSEEYVVKEVTFEADYRVSGGSHVRMNIKKGYYETTLNGEDVYALYAFLNIGGESYNYVVYVEPDSLDEYTSGILWIPAVYDMVNGPEWVKVEITGPNCHYSIDDSGNIEGDMDCGMISEDFQQYNMIWSYPTGFYGGIYGDVVEVNSLTGGQGYTVKPGGPVTIAGMEFETYTITWNGIAQNSGIQANGGTIVAPELPFPVEVTASLAMPGGIGIYVHAKLIDMKLEETS